MSATKATTKKQGNATALKVASNTFFTKAIVILIFITTAIYYQSLNNKFTNWDDNFYVVDNPNIRSLHGDSIAYSIKHAFTSYEMGNYHPITMLTYSMEYAKFKLNPKPYHITNLIIHILNSLLVFYFIWLLTKQQLTAFVTALLFAIHPMHVESIAWVSERKDVLYTFFSLISIISYIKYLTDKNRKPLYYISSLILFLLAVLSKAMAVCIPLIFILIDYFKGRKMTLKIILEKVPFLLISLVFGIVAIFAQKSLNALEDITHYNFFDRILFSCYSVFMYLGKAIVPINLSCFYSYPLKQNGLYPLLFYVAPVFILIVTVLIYKSKRHGKDIIFGFGFFVLSIVMVLQILPVGGAIIAERYTYIPYIGIFFIPARFLNNVFQNELSKFYTYKTPITIACVTIVMLFCYLTIKRCKVWENSIALWTDAIEKYDKAPRAYSHRAKANYELHKYNDAISDYSSYIFIKNNNPEIYYDRALCYFELKKYDNAINDFNKAIALKPEFTDAYYNRGIVYNDIKKYDDAINDYTLAIKYKPNHRDAYYNRSGAYYLTHQYQLALADALKAKELGFNVDERFISILKPENN